jgi:phosphoribosylanthranilate isomerase
VTRFKICGLTRRGDVEAAAASGASLLGFIHVPGTPRHLEVPAIAELTRVASPWLLTIGVIADRDPEEAVRLLEATGLDGLQLHGAESLEDVACLRERLPRHRLIKAARVESRSDVETLATFAPVVDALLIDSARKGRPFDWGLLDGVRFGCPLILAGGLTADNVGAAIDRVSPAMVDVSSGVERSPGVKDHDLLMAFARAVAGAGASVRAG